MAQLCEDLIKLFLLFSSCHGHRNGSEPLMMLMNRRRRRRGRMGRRRRIFRQSTGLCRCGRAVIADTISTDYSPCLTTLKPKQEAQMKQAIRVV
jgi:hypothetical protein